MYLGRAKRYYELFVECITMKSVMMYYTLELRQKLAILAFQVVQPQCSIVCKAGQYFT